MNSKWKWLKEKNKKKAKCIIMFVNILLYIIFCLQHYPGSWVFAIFFLDSSLWETRNKTKLGKVKKKEK